MENMKNTQIKRGQIYFCEIPKMVGSVYFGLRPVLIVSNDVNNRFSRCFTAVPITARVDKARLPTHVTLHTSCGVRRESLAMCENVSNYAKESLRNLVCELDLESEEWKSIETALKVQMGLA